MGKKNIDLLRDILKEIGEKDLVDITEAVEFLDVIETEFQEKVDKIIELEKELDDLENKDDEPVGYANADFVGLDTIRWDLDKGNLRIQQQMEGFIERMKNQYSATTV